MKMIPVASIDKFNLTIPERRANMRIDLDWLESKKACREGKDWFAQEFPEGCTYLELRSRLQSRAWESWLLSKVGGDFGTGGDYSTLIGGYRSKLTGREYSTLTGGDYSTLTGGNYSTLTGGEFSTLTGGEFSTLTGGYRSTLTGGDDSTLTSGHDSTLTGGDNSTLTGGDRSTLTGGYRSTLTGGHYSTLSITYWCDKTNRYRIAIAYVGEDGIEPNVAYKLDTEGKFVRA